MSDLTLIEPYLQGEIDPAFAVRARMIMEELVRARPAAVLDIGCGRGFYVKLTSFFDFPQKISGMDLRSEHLEKAAAIMDPADGRIELKQGSIYELPFADQSVDFIICSEVLEHLDQPDRGVSEIRRVLKPGGYAALTVPREEFPFLWDPLNWLLMRLFNTHVHKDIHWLAGIWADHERLYTKEQFEGHFREGFEIKRTENVLPYCWPFSHFMIYGIGKNLVERGFLKGLNRFTFDKPGPLKKFLASAMAAPNLWFNGKKREDRGINYFVLVRKT